jgi:hypothetical protein
MLTKIEVEDRQGHTLVLPLQDSTSGYTIKDIDGLDPVKSTIVFSSFAQLDGSQFQSSRLENRNIIIKIGIESYYGAATVREMRQALYAYFMPKTTVNIKVFIDGVEFAYIQGQVESCEAPLFSKDPEVVVSLLCFNPNFIGAENVIVTGNTVADATEQTIDYEGTVETGFMLELAVNRSLSAFTIYNRRPGGETWEFAFTAPLLTNDVVLINTLSRTKQAILTRAGNVSSVLYGVAPTSSWPNLWPGENFFRVLATGAAIPFSIDYIPKYGGL